MSGVRLSRALMPGMLERNWGRIVFISSELARQHPEGDDPLRLHQDRAARHRARPGRADRPAPASPSTPCCPGPTRSDGVETFLGALARDNSTTPDAMAATFVKTFRPTSLIERFATVEEVANMVVYVCSKEASATNGAALRVEGGLLRGIA